MVTFIRRIFIRGRTSTDEGGVLLVVIALLLIFSSLFIRYTSYTPLWNQHIVNVEQHYQEKMLYETALMYVGKNARKLQDTDNERGVLTFNLGKVDYHVTETMIELTVELDSGKVKTYRVEVTK